MFHNRKSGFISFLISRHEDHGQTRKSKFEKPIISLKSSFEHMFYAFLFYLKNNLYPPCCWPVKLTGCKVI